MSDQYDIKELIATFQRHHDIHLKLQEDLDIKYPDRLNKDEPEDDFSITLALKSMCEELVRLRGYISGVEDSIDDHMKDHD